MNLVPKHKKAFDYQHETSNKPDSWKFVIGRLLITIIGGTLLAQILWILFAMSLALPTTGVESWYPVMLAIHIACWVFTWKRAGKNPAKWK